MTNFMAALRLELERAARHAVVPIAVLYFADDIGQEGASAMGEGLAIVASYGIVLAWSKVREILTRLRAKIAKDDKPAEVTVPASEGVA